MDLNIAFLQLLPGKTQEENLKKGLQAGMPGSKGTGCGYRFVSGDLEYRLYYRPGTGDASKTGSFCGQPFCDRISESCKRIADGDRYYLS